MLYSGVDVVVVLWAAVAVVLRTWLLWRGVHVGPVGCNWGCSVLYMGELCGGVQVSDVVECSRA